jgi:hypothetical protein
MGQEFSKLKFQRQISECVALNQVIKLIFRGISVHVVTGVAEGCGETIPMPFLLFSRLDFENADENESDENERDDSTSQENPLILKSLDLQQFRFLRRYILELHKLFQCGATLENNPQHSRFSTGEECPICLDANVEVVLPCTHSFCSKCYDVAPPSPPPSPLIFFSLGVEESEPHLSLLPRRYYVV